MYVKEIKINRFRHLENITLGPFQEPSEYSDVIAIAGPNGSGKSSILELIGFALANNWSLSYKLSRQFKGHSFEVALALSNSERNLVMDYTEQTKGGWSEEVLNHFRKSNIYYRSFNYNDGEYNRNSTLYNNAHSLATNALKGHYNRSLGFFLKSNRRYPKSSFDRKKIFSYDNKNEKNNLWSYAYNTSDLQYQDMFDFLVQQHYHYRHNLGTYHDQINKGKNPTIKPQDPLEQYDKLLSRVFPGYTFSDSPNTIPDNLYINIPSGEKILFSDLSSGEKEIFFILSFFLRHDVRDSVIVIDEPELHLHPELARNLIKLMRNIRPNNQIWLATHNPEIIDEAGIDNTIYVYRNQETRETSVIPANDEEESIKAFRNLFGYSGYIGIAKKLVFLEGTDTSTDKKFFTTLFPEYSNKIKFIPAQSSENLPKLNAAIMSILESNLGWMEFHLIRDRDYHINNSINKYKNHSSGRLYVLDKYHIENYLLNEYLISKVMSDIFNVKFTEEQVVEKLKEIAYSMAGKVLRDMISFRLNLIYKPEDFSIGKYLEGKNLFDKSGVWDSESFELLTQKIEEKVKETNEKLLESTNSQNSQNLINECKNEIENALKGDDWKSLFPGREILNTYTKSILHKNNYTALQSNIIKEMATDKSLIPQELIELMNKISS